MQTHPSYQQRKGKLLRVKSSIKEQIYDSNSQRPLLFVGAREMRNVKKSNPFTVANLPLVINSVDKPNIRFYSPPTQHRSLFRNQPLIHLILHRRLSDGIASNKITHLKQDEQKICMPVMAAQQPVHENVVCSF